jgi:hypothetical protein
VVEINEYTAELIAKKPGNFLQKRGVGTLYIDPDSPWQNACNESFKGGRL